jgi:hypothetical protein
MLCIFATADRTSLALALEGGPLAAVFARGTSPNLRSQRNVDQEVSYALKDLNGGYNHMAMKRHRWGGICGGLLFRP